MWNEFDRLAVLNDRLVKLDVRLVGFAVIVPLAQGILQIAVSKSETRIEINRLVILVDRVDVRISVTRIEIDRLAILVDRVVGLVLIVQYVATDWQCGVLSRRLVLQLYSPL